MWKYFAVAFLLGAATAQAAITEEKALQQALAFANVSEQQLTALKIEDGEESGVKVYKLEFETPFGDYDFAYAKASGKLIDADYDLEDNYIKRHRGKQVMSAQAAKQLMSQKLHAPASAIYLEEQGGRNEPRFDGRCEHNQLEYEFEIDRLSGLIIDFTADYKD